MVSKFSLIMILVAYEFTSYSSRVIGQSLRAKQSNFSVRNIVALRYNDKCMVSNVKIPFNNYFAFNDHTICHYAKTKIRDRCDGTNKSLREGDMAELPPKSKTTGNQ